MPLFGNNKNKKMDLPEVADFSNDIWSYKGEPPVYQIQSDGFSYDIDDTDGNDKNAISLGLAGMLVIVLNAKSPKIREDELLPHLGKVIKTRNWHTMTVKEANFLVQTAIKKLTSSSTSGDVFDLASYAPLEVKRSLLKTLFTISRMQMKPEFREEAEHRIIDDIVPAIFANPEYELASLTGLIIKSDTKAASPSSSKIETSAVLDPEVRFDASEAEKMAVSSENTPSADSAYAELQKIYGRKADTVKSQNPSLNNEPVTGQNVQEKDPNQDANPSSEEPKSIPPVPAPAFMGAKPNNPFSQYDQRGVPQPGAPNFSVPQPNMPSFGTQQNMGIPQPPVPNFVQQPNNPFMNMNQSTNNLPLQNGGYPMQNSYTGNNMPAFQGQMRQPQNMPNATTPQMPYPGQVPNSQMQQNVSGYPQYFNPQQYSDGRTQQPYSWMNRSQNYQQPNQMTDPTTQDQSGKNA